MSLLLDALKQAEKTKERVDDKGPIAEDNRVVTIEGSIEESPVNEIDTVIAAEENESSLADPAVIAAERLVEPDKRLYEGGNNTSPTEKPVLASAKLESDLAIDTVQVQYVKAQATQPIAPALNVFAVGEKSSKLPAKEKELALVGVLILLLVLAVVLYFWPVDDAEVVKFGGISNSSSFVEDQQLEQAVVNNRATEEIMVVVEPGIVSKVEKLLMDPGGASFNNKKVVEDTPLETHSGITITKKSFSRSMLTRLNKAYLALKNNNFSQAGVLYSEILRRYPNQIDAKLGLAHIASHNNDLVKARVIYKEVLAQDASNKTAQLGMLYTFQNVSPIEKTSSLKSMNSKFENQPEILVSIGHELAKQGKWSEAQSYYFKAFSLDNSSAIYVYNLAVSLDRMGKYAAAINFYKQVLKLGSSSIQGLNSQQIGRRINELEALGE
ncbi:MAG: hypothetical protein COB62_03225 [Piscirickettsiaceae bacterium]|nr:MAG: hypothetical protein COB62_03225 [Piscirickettsiaceae bacterium]